jgi:hypothetical protein
MITSDATNDVVLQRKKATRRPGLRACRTASPAARPSYEPSQNPPGVLSPDVYVTLTANVASSISTRVPPAAATGPPRQSPRPRRPAQARPTLRLKFFVLVPSAIG